MLKVTTSWDDGDILDKRLADLLSRYGATGTFYTTKNYRQNRLSESDIRELAKKHEVGAHTLTHPDLRSLTPEKLREEIAGGKQWLESVTGGEIKMFCYPKGFYNKAAAEAAKEAGFLGARTTVLAHIDLPADNFDIHTTLQVYPFPFRKNAGGTYYWRKLFEPLTQRASALKKIGVSTLSMYSWLSLAKATFDAALEKGEIFHLWGHSWEIEKYGMWEDLEKFLQYISEKSKNEKCRYVTNGDLVTIIDANTDTSSLSTSQIHHE